LPSRWNLRAAFSSAEYALHAFIGTSLRLIAGGQVESSAARQAPLKAAKIFQLFSYENDNGQQEHDLPLV
jgi:hypothetical protein